MRLVGTNEWMTVIDRRDGYHSSTVDHDTYEIGLETAWI